MKEDRTQHQEAREDERKDDMVKRIVYCDELRSQSNISKQQNSKEKEGQLRDWKLDGGPKPTEDDDDDDQVMQTQWHTWL